MMLSDMHMAAIVFDWNRFALHHVVIIKWFRGSLIIGIVRKDTTVRWLAQMCNRRGMDFEKS